MTENQMQNDPHQFCKFFLRKIILNKKIFVSHLGYVAKAAQDIGQPFQFRVNKKIKKKQVAQFISDNLFKKLRRIIFYFSVFGF
jgi:hypothetical protein